ncbi:MAG: carboxypeptidase M32 [Anaerolineales bacterium]|nr:carboxypeptidase M32 [Anaerolineales bacterium]MDW8276479.1 carboxypeptidase M32 [Anaerolineales bacterium]
MNPTYQQLKARLAEIADLHHAAALIGWDQQVYMPPAAAEEHGNMLGTLGKIAHEKFTSDETGKLLEELKRDLPHLDPDSEEYRLIKITAKDYDRATRVPAEFVVEQAQVTAIAHQAWAEARARSEFGLFQPHLEKILDLVRRYVTFFPPADHPYDTLLDNFEPGMKTAEVQAIFEALRPRQVELIRAIGERPQVEDSFLHLQYDEKTMWDFSVEVATAFGYDWKRGRQDPTVHPFCTSFGVNDVRITSRWVPDLPFALLFGTMHETGHALYEQGVGLQWNRTPVEGGASLGLHESQSRMWENLVGRSRPFWEYFYPKLQARFPSQLANVSLDQFYRTINKVQPSLIRVEADEATYNLHIMLRLEIEIAMLEGKVAVRDLPELWNAKMQDYLGLTPPNDALGVLQDVHWSGGMIGYFSTYALGNIISAQLWEKFNSTHPQLEDEMRSGDFSALLSWLRAEIHQYGRKYEPQELVQRVTGESINSAPYLRYLQKKYAEIYNL